MFYLRKDSPQDVVDYYNSNEFLTSHLHWSDKRNYAQDHSGRLAHKSYYNRLSKEAAALSKEQIDTIKNSYKR